MPVIIGVDEAGYGPNYGPLCVAATAWRVDGKAESGERKAESGKRKAAEGRQAAGGMSGGLPPRAATLGDVDVPDLYRLLRDAVGRSPDKAGRKLAIADSKALYTPATGLRQLERGVLAALQAALRQQERSGGTRGSETRPANTGARVRRAAELLAATGADRDGRRAELACHADDDQPLPLDAAAEEIGRLAELLHRACTRQGVTLLAMRARLVYPAEFNALIEHYGTKGTALSHVTLALVREVVDGILACPAATVGDEAVGAERVVVCLDKHGGRSRYAALLQHHFPESWIEPLAEHRKCSRYRWVLADRPMEAVFRVGCEELLPTALASMTAKYHRELAMRAFNAFWAARLPDLRPTAGYPNDSHRFRTAIAAVQRALGIDDRLLWRQR